MDDDEGNGDVNLTRWLSMDDDEGSDDVEYEGNYFAVTLDDIRR